MIKKKLFYLNNIIFFLFDFFLIWYIDIYIDIYIYKLFQTCSIQIDLGTCLNRGYMICVYLNSSNIHNVIKYLTVRLSGVNTAT